jgi:hypothetical protein
MSDPKKLEQTIDNLNILADKAPASIKVYLVTILTLAGLLVSLWSNFQSCNNEKIFKEENKYYSGKVDSVKTVLTVELKEQQQKTAGIQKENSILAEKIKSQNEQIKTYAKIIQGNRLKLNIPIVYKVDTVTKIKESVFDTLGQWFNIYGKIDTSNKLQLNIYTWDTLEAFITENSEKNIKGYVINKNPFNIIDKLYLDFQYPTIENKWNWLSFGAGAVAILTILICGVLIK